MTTDDFKQYMVQSMTNKLVDLMESEKDYSPADMRKMFQLFKELSDEIPETIDLKESELNAIDKDIITRYVLKSALNFGFTRTIESDEMCKKHLGYIPLPVELFTSEEADNAISAAVDIAVDAARSEPVSGK